MPRIPASDPRFKVFAAGVAIGWIVANAAPLQPAQTVSLCAPNQISVQEAFSPKQGATELVITSINNAKQSIRMAAYSFTSKPIAEALVAAHRRGVTVQVVVDDKANEGERNATGTLLQAGVPMRFNSRYAIMHNKFIVIDGHTLETGSFNFTHAAEEHNAENVLVLHAVPEITQAYDTQWVKLWNEAAEKKL